MAYKKVSELPVCAAATDDDFLPIVSEGETKKIRLGDISKNMSDIYNHNTFANALKGTASGVIVALDDVSPLEHNIGIKLRSKNLFDVSKVPSGTTPNGIIGINNGNGSITIKGYAYNTGLRLKDIAPNLKAGDTAILTVTYDNAPSYKSIVVGVPWDYGKAVTVTEEMLNCVVNMYGNRNYTADDETTIVTLSNIQIEIGTEATAHVPYVADDTEIAVKSCGKNLFNNTYWDLDKHESDTISTGGVRYTRLEDGRLHLKGVADTFSALNIFGDGTTQFSDFLRDGATYCFSVHAEGTGSNGVLIGGQYTNNAGKSEYIMSNDERYIHTVNKSLNSYKWLRIQVTAGTEVDCIVGIQIEVNNSVTDYEPYQEYTTTTTTIAEGAELTSVAPNMTIFTDNAGVVVETEYNRDSNIVIEKLTQAIISLGGNI